MKDRVITYGIAGVMIASPTIANMIFAFYWGRSIERREQKHKEELLLHQRDIGAHIIKDWK
jgi:hypothetical protein